MMELGCLALLSRRRRACNLAEGRDQPVDLTHARGRRDQHHVVERRDQRAAVVQRDMDLGLEVMMRILLLASSTDQPSGQQVTRLPRLIVRVHRWIDQIDPLGRREAEDPLEPFRAQKQSGLVDEVLIAGVQGLRVRRQESGQFLRRETLNFALQREKPS